MRLSSVKPAHDPRHWMPLILKAAITMSERRMHRRFLFPVVLLALAVHAQTVDVVEVSSEKLQRTVKLPGEFLPWQTVDLHAKVAGFVETVRVDRGSQVRRGELLVTLSAPEMK